MNYLQLKRTEKERELNLLFQTIISATQSRKKQQTELVRSVLYAEKDKKRKERENLPITSLPVEMLAAQVCVIMTNQKPVLTNKREVFDILTNCRSRVSVAPSWRIRTRTVTLSWTGNQSEASILVT